MYTWHQGRGGQGEKAGRSASQWLATPMLSWQQIRCYVYRRHAHVSRIPDRYFFSFHTSALFKTYLHSSSLSFALFLRQWQKINLQYKFFGNVFFVLPVSLSSHCSLSWRFITCSPFHWIWLVVYSPFVCRRFFAHCSHLAIRKSTGYY